MELINEIIKKGDIIYNGINRKIIKYEDKILKYGTDISISEGLTMKYIKKNTNIPVPDVICIDKKEDISYIVMKYIEGDILENIWNFLDKKDKDDIWNQMSEYIDSLRKLKNNKIIGINDFSCRDPINIDNIVFNSIYEFNKYLKNILYKKHKSYFIDFLIDDLDNKKDIVFTHSDISKRNIIVKNNKILAIIDWEMAGYYPEYWEYTKCLYNIDWSSDWVIYANKHMKKYKKELLIMMNVRKILNY